MRVITRQTEVLRLVLAHPDFAQWRANRVASTRRVITALVYRMDWETGGVTAAWEAVQADAGVSESTLNRVLNWCRDTGQLVVVRPGISSARLCATYAFVAPLADEEAPVAVPAQPAATSESPAEDGAADVTGGPSWSPRSGDHQVGSYRSSLHARAREERGDFDPNWPINQQATTKNERYAATARVRAEARLWLSRVSVPALAHELREFLHRGYSPRAVIHALHYRPDGTRWEHTVRPHSPAGWVRYRLNAWRDQHGDPLPSPFRASTAADEARRIARQGELAAIAAIPAQQARPADSAAYSAYRAATRRGTGAGADKAAPAGRAFDRLNAAAEAALRCQAGPVGPPPPSVTDAPGRAGDRTPAAGADRDSRGGGSSLEALGAVEEPARSLATLFAHLTGPQ